MKTALRETQVLDCLKGIQDPKNPSFITHRVLSRCLQKKGIYLDEVIVAEALRRLKQKKLVARYPIPGAGRTKRFGWLPLSMLEDDMGQEPSIWLDPSPNCRHLEKWENWKTVIQPYTLRMASALAHPEHPFHIINPEIRVSAYIHHFLRSVLPTGPANIQWDDRYLEAALIWTRTPNCEELDVEKLTERELERGVTPRTHPLLLHWYCSEDRARVYEKQVREGIQDGSEAYGTSFLYKWLLVGRDRLERPQDPTERQRAEKDQIAPVRDHKKPILEGDHRGDCNCGRQTSRNTHHACSQCGYEADFQSDTDGWWYCAKCALANDVPEPTEAPNAY